MTSIPYPIGSSVDFLREGMINNYDQKGIMELGKIGEYMSNISCRVQEMIETGLHHITPDLSNVETLRGKGEEKTRELLRDTHNTFGLFMRGLSMASGYLKAGKNTSVELYKEDVNNKEFVQGVKLATDEGKYAKGLTLDIRPEEHGSIGKKSIEKLHEVCELGVGIGIEAFPEDSDGDINIDTIRSLIQNKIKPKFIKISNNVLAKIKNNKVTKQIINLYKGLISMGIHIIKYDNGIVTKDNTDEINKKKYYLKPS